MRCCTKIDELTGGKTSPSLTLQTAISISGLHKNGPSVGFP